MNDFLASMPAGYGKIASAAEVREHARIAQQRGARLAYAEPCTSGGAPVVCLVADDRPGLLSLVTDALLVHGLGVRKAQAYCRKRADDGRTEAIDFMELYRSNAAGAVEVDASELAAFVQTLTELIVEDAPSSMARIAARVSSERRTRAYFELDALARGEYVLVVDAPDSQGLLNSITSALYAQGSAIAGCQIDTEAGFARNRFELALGGFGAPSSAELCDIQLAVLSALPRPHF
jgi:UTP:GlnB (protein PII) uridylyltransferase